MNILLTGGTGYIGSHTAVVLSELHHQVVLFDNLANSQASVCTKLEQITGKKMPFIQGDIRDTALLTEVMRKHEIDAVVHFAGLKSLSESMDIPIEYFQNNVQGTLSLLQAMKSQSIKTLVFSSSAAIYGQPQYLPVDEQHPTSTSNPYGRSKLHIEEILQDVALSDPTWRIACLRYFNPVGAHSSGLIGDNPSGIPNSLMPYVAQVAVGQRPELNVFGNDYDTPDGTGVRDFIHVMDLAQGHTAALAFLAREAGWHAINLGTGRGYSVLELVHAFERSTGQKIPFQIAPRRSCDVASCYANAEKAKTLMQWQANRTLDDMCESTWKFQQQLDQDAAT